MKEIKYSIPNYVKPQKCRGCGAKIYWIKTKKGKYMPVNPDGIPHWATCPKANDFKKSRSGSVGEGA